MTKRALISLRQSRHCWICPELKKAVGIISTGGTKVAPDNAGVETIAIDDVTGFQRRWTVVAKTLHQISYGGLTRSSWPR